MDDILTTARQSLEWDEGHHMIVEQLCDEVERLRAALKLIADCYDGVRSEHPAEVARDALRAIEQNAGKTEGK